MQVDLEENPGDAAMSPQENQARWAFRNYYKHARDFVVRNSLDEKKFAHRFVDSIFQPLLALQSIAEEENRLMPLRLYRR